MDHTLVAPQKKKLFGWPGYANLAYAAFVIGPLMTVWFVLIYAGSDYLTGLHDVRIRLHHPIELKMPFVPAMVVFYNSMHIAYMVAPFVLRTRPEMNAMAATWFVITLVAGIVFLLLPSEDAFPTPTDQQLGPWLEMFRLADQANLRFNSCPSLHVAWGVVCVDVYARSAEWRGQLLLWIWAIGMILSTLLLHQHHIADAFGGLILALIGSRILFPRLLMRFSKRKGDT